MIKITDMYKDELPTLEQIQRAEALIEKVNRFFEDFNNHLTVTSGIRTITEHINIYKNIARKKNILFDQSKVPMGSQHLKGNAIDLADSNNVIKAYVNANIPLAEELGLYFESFLHTPNWVHIQQVPPKSGNRFFNP